MPLNNLSFTINHAWQFVKTNVGFQQTRQGSDSQSFGMVPTITGTQDQVAAQYTVGAFSTQDVNLYSYTNLIGEATGLRHMLTFLVNQPTAQIVVGPSPANGFNIWGGTNTVTVPASGVVAFSCAVSSAGYGVTPTSGSIRLTNNGAAPAVVTIVGFGTTI